MAGIYRETFTFPGSCGTEAMFSFPFNFEISESELQVRLRNWTIRRLPYSDIKAIELPEGAWIRWHFGLTERWVNFSAQACIVIRRRSRFLGMEKIMIINPPDRDDFASRLKAKIVPS